MFNYINFVPLHGLYHLNSCLCALNTLPSSFGTKFMETEHTTYGLQEKSHSHIDVQPNHLGF